VRDALNLTGLSARQLELEITETALLNDSEATLATLHRFRDRLLVHELPAQLSIRQDQD
jgi:EAL domain-containing protein (putative c-di-GMP-specific phosphodiesterase class I)